MYTKYWNLTSSPFLSVDSEKLLYPSPQLEEGVARLFYLIDQERLAGLLTGPYGIGKTFLLGCLARRTAQLKLPLIRFDAIPNGALPMARHILRSIGVDAAPTSLPDALMLFQQAVVQQSGRLVRHILIIDEAHYLGTDEGLYLVHFLCNLRIRANGRDMPLFSIILSGTPNLNEMVNRYDSLRLRIQLSWVLTPLTAQQTVEYVQQHIRAAGGDIWIFTEPALRAVYECSQGIPRSINNICDTALVLGYAARQSAISPEIVMQAARDTNLLPVQRAEQPAPAPVSARE